jgi:hypothetical protein
MLANQVDAWQCTHPAAFDALRDKFVFVHLHTNRQMQCLPFTPHRLSLSMRLVAAYFNTAVALARKCNSVLSSVTGTSAGNKLVSIYRTCNHRQEDMQQTYVEH